VVLLLKRADEAVRARGGYGGEEYATGNREARESDEGRLLNEHMAWKLEP
jgi:hypothetical protein